VVLKVLVLKAIVKGIFMKGPAVNVQYDDKAVRSFLLATLIFGVIGMLVGVFIALQLAWSPANFGISFLTFGRLRPLHTNAVIFAFGGNAIFAGMYYSLQRLLKTRMWSDILSQMHFWGWQLIIVAAVVTLPLGLTSGKEYAELEWPIDIAITLVWVIMAINVFMTIAVRRVKHLYVSIWFYLGTILTIAMLHIVNSLALPISLFKSYSIYAGMQDALVQWWYGHNAVGFFLTTPFLGMMYYFIPKAVGQPVFSYRLSIIHFWSLVFIYIWTGPHHLLYSALPEWAQTLGMIFSIMLLAPSWGGMLNGVLTIRPVWDRVRHDPVVKFFVVALTFYGMSTFEGPLMAIKAVNLVSHYTDWTIAHVHSGTLGWVGGMIFAMTYYLVPKLWGRPLYSERLADRHFWISTVGIVFYITSMWAAGVTQFAMWWAKTPEGLLKYPQFLETVLALKWLYWVRLVGGLMYLTGAMICLYNVLMTVFAADATAKDEEVLVYSEIEHVATTLHERLENKGLLFGILVVIGIAIGGIAELVPTFAIESNVPTITAVKPYTPLELHGRDIYIREGCYNCHSQLVRTHAVESLRYGSRSYAGEYVYDHPFQWGSKRTGPDLHRVGQKYPNFWHYKHMIRPESMSPGSIMPTYPWLEESLVDMDQIEVKVAAMKSLGVPYTDSNIKDSRTAYLSQAQTIVSSLAADNVVANPQSELISMIAYLQRLGTDLKNADPKELQAN
jgi:cytochrome c oxidase cbb3-type subunit I/II